MFQLFLHPIFPKLDGYEKYPEWNYVSDYIRYNIKIIREYYQNTSEQVSNNNIIAELIQTVTTKFTLDNDRFLQDMKSDIKFKANILGLGVDNNRPTIFKNQFCKNSYEIFICNDNPNYYLNFMKTHKDKNSWKDLIPIRPIYHNYSLLDFEIREFKRDMEGSICIYEVDLISLIMMFKHWVDDRNLYSRTTRPYIFLATYVIPNMLMADIDLVLFNRILKKGVVDRLPVSIMKKYPFFLRSVEVFVDKILDKMLNSFNKKSLQYERLLKTIPTLKYENKDMLDILKINNFNFNIVQSRWVLWLARLPYVRGLLNIGNIGNLSLNKEYVNNFRSELREYSTNNVLIRASDIGHSNYNKFIEDLSFCKDVLAPDFNIKI